MILRTISVAALLLSTAAAFRNTSPFFLYSTSPLPNPFEPLQVSSASSISNKLDDILRLCASDAYILISQPGVAASDFATRRSAPNLQSWLNQTEAGFRARKHAAWTVNDVIGTLDAGAIVSQIERDCKASIVQVDASTGIIPSGDNAQPRIVNVEFPPLKVRSVEERVNVLAEHDSFLHAVVSSHGGEDFTILYLTTPPAENYIINTPPYEMENKYEQVMHTDLKRDIYGAAKSNSSSNAPLFEKYQFLSTGLFIGIFASIILFSILYVGITAIAGLQVSYFAFSKEMGPSQQKKQQ